MRPCPKKPKLTSRPYIEWIKRHECYICGSWDEVDVDGGPLVTPSHIKAGRAKDDYDNLIPMCVGCHRRFESQHRREKEGFIPIARDYTNEYFKQFPEERVRNSRRHYTIFKKERDLVLERSARRRKARKGHHAEQ